MPSDSADQPDSDNCHLGEMQRHSSRWAEADLNQSPSSTIRLTTTPAQPPRQSSHVLHQFLEFARLYRLLTVTQGTFRIQMDFNQEAIRPAATAAFDIGAPDSTCPWHDWIDDDGQMRELFQCWNRSKIERIAILRLEVLIPRSHNMTF